MYIDSRCWRRTFLYPPVLSLSTSPSAAVAGASRSRGSRDKDRGNRRLCAYVALGYVRLVALSRPTEQLQRHSFSTGGKERDKITPTTPVVHAHTRDPPRSSISLRYTKRRSSRRQDQRVLRHPHAPCCTWAPLRWPGACINWGLVWLVLLGFLSSSLLD